LPLGVAPSWVCLEMRAPACISPDKARVRLLAFVQVGKSFRGSLVCITADGMVSFYPIAPPRKTA